MLCVINNMLQCHWSCKHESLYTHALKIKLKLTTIKLKISREFNQHKKIRNYCICSNQHTDLMSRIHLDSTDDGTKDA